MESNRNNPTVHPEILVSACLAGEPCRYDGKANTNEIIQQWVREGHALPFCPECEGGLPTPRIPAEIRVVNGCRKVYNKKGEDMTAAFQNGAEKALKTAQRYGCRKAVLKAKSPSCGYGRIYDGSFEHRLTEGNGLTAELLQQHGMEIKTETDDELQSFATWEKNAPGGKKMKKTILGIVFGGQSGEHEVSRVSAYNVLQVINREKYDIRLIGITKQGKWFFYSGDEKNIPKGNWEEDSSHLESCFAVFDKLSDIDIFFPILHGPMGEDGTIQGVFEMLGKPYVGCSVLASAAGMDKVISKILFENAGIPVTPGIAFTRKQWDRDTEKYLDAIEEKLGYPAFVKPVNMGSSVGVTKAHDRDELLQGILTALNYDNKILVETFINGREIECAVLETDGQWQATIPGEIVASKEFYDYEAKYSDEQDSKILIPAPIPEEVSEKIRDYAVRAIEAIDGSGLSRVDFFYTRDTEEVIINEVNTLPGFTNISMYPKMWENMGMSYAELVEILICSAARKRMTDYTV